MDRVMLSCGNGGRENAELINDVFLRYFNEFSAFSMEDSGLFGDFATSIDSYTINPIFFPGGDIGKLSVCGSCNDVAVMGAKPMYISLALMIEEGFLISNLHKIAQSIAHEIKSQNLQLLSADTKVLPKGAVSEIFITTNVIGKIMRQNLSAHNLQDGDTIVLSAPIGAHGACIYCLRNNINISSGIQSDCASLWQMIEMLLQENIEIHAMRDATRGGIASLLNEWARTSMCEIHINESEVLVSSEVRGICEILGLEPYSIANEGVCAFAMPRNATSRALKILHKTSTGRNAKIIGEVKKTQDSKVILHNEWGARRYLEYPQGEILPRIC